MQGYISQNLDKFLQSTFTKLLTKELIPDILAKLDVLIIDTNWLNDETMLFSLLAHIRRYSRCQIILICYRDFDYLRLYQYHVYDVIRHFKAEDLCQNILNLIANPTTISPQALIYELRNHYQQIEAFISFEHKSYTTSLINALYQKQLATTCFISASNHLNKLSLFSDEVMELTIKPSLYQNVMALLNTSKQYSHLIIDFGVCNETNWEFFKALMPLVDQLYVIDTNNQLTHQHHYYQKMKDNLLKFDNSFLVQIPNWNQKRKYKKFLKAIKSIKK